jgi:hypothetical protein
MRHTDDLSNNIFSGGKVLATAPGPVLGAAIQLHPTTNTRTLIAVVAEVGSGGIGLPGSPDLSGTVTAEHVYLLPLDPPGSWVQVGTFTRFSTDPDSTLPKQTSYPTHYFFNASVTEAVSAKPIAGCRETSCWRTMNLTVNTESDSASFMLQPAKTLDKVGDFSYSGTAANYSNRYDIDYTEPGIAADYIGDRLVQLHSRQEHHGQASGSMSGDRYRTSTGEDHQTWRETLKTSDDWTWEREKGQHDGSGTRTWDIYEGIPGSSYGGYQYTQLTRRVEFIDLRFVPPVVAYVETQSDFASVDSDGNRETRRETSQEKLAWLVAGSVQNVTGFHNIPFAANGESSEFIATSDGPGTFVVGGLATAPQVIGEHRYEQGTYHFMYPEGALSNYGGGPVGR